MKVLTVAGWIHPDAEGGSFRFVYELNKALARRGHEVTILTGHIRDGLPPEEEIDGIHVIRYPVKKDGTFGFYRSTYNSIKEYLPPIAGNFDAIHLHHPVSAFAAAYTLGDGFPLVHTLHIAYFLEYLDRVTPEHAQPAGGQRLGGYLLKRMETYTLAKCRRVATLSETVKRMATEHLAVPPEKITRIPAGVELERFAPGSRTEARRRLGFAKDRPLLLTIRRLEPRMGIDNLLDAMPAILEEFPDCLLMIGGRGSLANSLERQALDELQLDGFAQFLGMIDEADLADCYRAADLFVLPTRALEGFGMVTLESFASGTPAVVTPAGASPELAEPVDPQLVAAGTAPEDLAEAIIRFLKRSDRDQLRQRCRSFAENFTWDSAAEKYEELYQQISAAQRA